MTQLHLLRERRFAPLFWTQFFGAFNDNFMKNALVILVVFRSVTIFGLPYSQIVALAGGLFILPFFLFSALAGQVADKYEKETVIRWIKAAEIAIMLTAAFGFLFQLYGLLLVALFSMGLHSTFFGPIKYSILPQHLRVEELVGGTALVEAGTFVAILLGTIAGTKLIAIGHGERVVSLGLVFVALVGYAICLFIPRAPAVAPDLKIQLNPVSTTVEIFRYARKPLSVFVAIIGISWFWFFGVVMLSIFPPLAKDVLGGNADMVTLLLSLFTIGIAVGSMLTGRLSKHGLELGYVPIGAAGVTLSSLGLYFCCRHPVTSPQSTWAFVSSLHGFFTIASLLLFSILAGFFIVPLYTLMTQRSEKTERSRVIAANNVLNALFMVVASVFLMVLLGFHVSLAQAILIHSILNVVVTIYLIVRMPEIVRRPSLSLY